MPLEDVQVLAQNLPPLPSVGPSFGEECSQLHVLAKVHSAHSIHEPWSFNQVGVVHNALLEQFPKLAGKSDDLKKIVEHPLALQMTCQTNVMISVWTDQIQPIASEFTGDGMGVGLGHLWMSVELLRLVSNTSWSGNFFFYEGSSRS
jgi:hypothetical protein